MASSLGHSPYFSRTGAGMAELRAAMVRLLDERS